MPEAAAPHDRSLLGAADVSDAELTQLVAAALGTSRSATELIGSHATRVAYDVPSITTAGRYWVRGTASVAGRETAYSLFVKVVRAWSRSPFFADVPLELREMAAAGVPWRTEALVYRSDLHDRLPEGLTMPRALAVHDLPDEACSIWLPEIEVEPRGPWSLERYAAAARLLGRLAASPAVAELAEVGEFPWGPHVYLHGRVESQVLPVLRSPDVWRHPLVAGAFDATLRARLLDAADRAGDITDELAALPVVTGHGDACPSNLLVGPSEPGFVLIDFGFWNRLPIGYDLGQLLVGDVQGGHRSATDLAAIDTACVPAYVEGLSAEGHEVDERVVRRAHALQLVLFVGLSALPFEHLGTAASPALHRDAAERAGTARYCLDLLDATA